MPQSDADLDAFESRYAIALPTAFRQRYRPPIQKGGTVRLSYLT
jgi:hypothetical protein